MAGFKARARALDMLGRQQIAGIPTAISELFKNAHDAYADNVIVDYFRSDRLFVLRDDGYGMTRSDFENKWLTLGTESKYSFHGSQSEDSNLPDYPFERAIMGEKGIGRLAIASIGDHVLILTRALRKDGLHDLVMAFVYWRMYEIPGINLEQVVVPIKEIPYGNLPNESDFKELCNEVIQNIEELYNEGFIESEKDKAELLSPLSKLSLVADKIDKYVLGPSLKGSGHGTHFIICPASDMMDDSLGNSFDTENPDERVSPMKEMLLGFCNTMFQHNNDKPLIKTSFRDHKTDEYYEDLIEQNEFWTLGDYEKADHKIQGKFDEYGQFKGDVTVFGKKFENHIINWGKNKGLKTKCGPFSIQFGYVQGNVSETLMSSEDFSMIIRKLNNISGLYIYRDGIRILPYGDSAHDYLKLEERRNKSNSYYFFSNRRMFGTINISRENNPELSEKAGREGLRENLAYKQFIDILTNLFLQLAADFFRDSDKTSAGPNAEYFVQQKQLIKSRYLAKQQFEKQAKVKKEKFERELENYFVNYNNKAYLDDISTFFDKFDKGKSYSLSLPDSDKAVSAFLNLEQNARKSLWAIFEKYKLKQPRSVQMSKRTQQDYETYLGLYEVLNTTVFKEARERLEKELNDCQKAMHANVSRRKRLELAVDTTITHYKKETKSEVNDVQKIAREVTAKVIQVSKEWITEYESIIRSVQLDLSKIDPYQLDDDKLVDERYRMETTLTSTAEKINERIGNIKRQLDNLVLTGDASNLDALDFYAEEVENLKERLNADIELSQLGLAVSAIQHEFQSTVTSIRTQIKRFKAWADLNDGLKDIYDRFRVNFEHLDNYLTIFLPLNRRLYRKEVQIFGNDTYNFLKDVFFSRISENRHNISLTCSTEFAQNTIWGYPSSFYPVYVNIVDNAIFWLKDKTMPKRKIHLDTDQDGSIYISNNGPGIDIRDFQRIFEVGFSRKPNGRGMGLFISKEVLNKAGYDIILVKPLKGYNVTFKIYKKNKEEN